MSKQLKQVIKLSQQTGDRVIVFDNSAPEESFVLMTLDQYQDLINSDSNSLTEKKIVDNIGSNNEKSKKNNNWSIPSQVKEESE
ncbi:MAG: hypothetical protein ACOXZ1_01520 [Patescibacteria group bacterium]|jgi:hypothetical protein|nr:hypothetical protein [Patescibacteria group bacterium]